MYPRYSEINRYFAMQNAPTGLYKRDKCFLWRIGGYVIVLYTTITRQAMYYNITLRRVRATIVAVNKQ